MHRCILLDLASRSSHCEAGLDRRAAAGKYQVRAKYFAQDANRASTRTKVHATIYEGFGTPHVTVTRKTTLVAGKEMHEIAAAVQEFEPPGLSVTASGEVPTSGWENAVLVRVVYDKPPADGIQDYILFADRPSAVEQRRCVPLACAQPPRPLRSKSG